MQWLVYALASAVFFAGWAFFGKLSLSHASWAQVGFIYGIATVLLFTPLLLVAGRRSFAGSNGWELAGSGLCGALGLVMFYLALDRGKASVVVPLVSAYPLITTLLAIAFLGESLTALQAIGVACVVGGAALIGLAG